jgi:putative nucleotidyltransferase with HDIG domain
MNNTKKILVEELKTGMYISDLNAPYIDHPFFYNHFIIENEKTIEKIKECGIRSVYIDPSKGMDEPNAPTYLEINKKMKEMMGKIFAEDKRREENKNIVQIHVREEIPVAEKVRSKAITTVRNVLNDVRSGQEIATKDVMSTAVLLADTVIRCPEAIHLISSIKDKDDYTFQHSVSVCSLLVAFCNITGFDKESIYAVALGGLLHDVGKAKIDDRILKKPGRLTREEFEIIKTHVVEGKKILDKTRDIPDLAKHITYEHHERYDGMGYPTGLKGEEISKIGRMAAICDVYDAMSSERVYHRALIPYETLRKIFEWSTYHFDRVLVEQFVHMMGIYPVGTLVMLESGFVSIVLQQNGGSLLQPLVRTFYDSFAKRFARPVEIDLSKNTSEKIIGAVSLEQLKLNINLIDMLQTA